MSDEMQGGGFMARLRDNETLRRFSGGRPDLLIFGVPAAVIAIAVAGVVTVMALSGGGDGGGDAQASAPTPTAEASATVEATPTPANAGLKTPIAVSPGDLLTLQDLANRGAGLAPAGEFTGERIMIPKIGVDAPFSFKTVPYPGGKMPNPNGPTDVAFYDFSLWGDALGGLPGKGGNVVVAGHVDYINYGPAVFWDLSTLRQGDRVQIRLKDGTIAEYAIEFNKTVEAVDADWTAIVAATAEESITLITCVGQFSAGQYSNRQIAWGRRVA